MVAGLGGLGGQGLCVHEVECVAVNVLLCGCDSGVCNSKPAGRTANNAFLIAGMPLPSLIYCRTVVQACGPFQDRPCRRRRARWCGSGGGCRAAAPC